MKDISGKAVTERRAIAQAVLYVKPSTIEALKAGTLPKGDPLPIAKVAAIQAAKNTSQIIPYCHPLPIEFVGVQFDIQKDHVKVTVEVAALYKTGVEMEALTAAGVAALTIYDMTKGLDPEMRIAEHCLLSKTGGKSDLTLKSKNHVR
jgi:cyclic pyranopterin phosphate synthase